jgi:hypothetical protein
MFVDGDSKRVNQATKRRMLAHILNNFPDSLEKTRILQDGVTDSNAIAAELVSISEKSRSMGQGSHRHWPVIGRHTSKFAVGDERCFGAELHCSQCRGYTCRSRTDHTDIHEASES